MSYGNGAYIVHKVLESRLPDYQIKGYSPRFEFCPFLMPFISRPTADIIHTTPDYGYLFERRDTPLVITFHNYVLDRFMQSYSSIPQRIHYRTDLLYLTRKALERADMVTSVSNFTANLVRKELGYRKEIRVIYNGVDLERFRPVRKKSNSPIKVLFAGNLTRRKGADLLPEIARRLNRGIVIQYARGLRAKPHDFTSERLIDLGSIEHSKMPKVYRQADILLLPTVREGLPLVVMEAMASGLPVVSTNCSSLPELIINGKGGFLCELGDVQDFVEKINSLASSEALRSEMGQYNRKMAENHLSLSRMVRNYQELFDEVAG
jgi:glycosyltransferase involved in cell wall biosynthesis